MALLRPCGSLIRAISKLPVPCQLECIVGVIKIVRFEGYVTLAPKSSYAHNLEKFESTIASPLNNSPDALNTKEIKIPRLKSHLQRQLLSLCRSSATGKIREDLLKLFITSKNGNFAYDDSLALSVLRYCGSSLSSIDIEDRKNFVAEIWKVILDNAALSVTHYNTLLRVSIENNETVEPEKFLSKMLVEPTAETYRLLLKSSSKLGKIDAVLYLVSKVKHLEDFTEEIYNYLIEAYIVNKNLDAALSTLEKMKLSKVEPSLEIYSKIACGYISFGDIENTKKILKEHSLGFDNILEILKAASKAGNGKFITELLKFLPSFICEYDPMIIDTIKAMIHEGNPEDAYETIKSLIDVISIDNSNPIFETFLKNLIYAKLSNEEIIRYANKVSKEMNYELALFDICEAALQTENRELALAIFEVMHEGNIVVRPHFYWPVLLQSSRLYGEADVMRILKHMICLNVPIDHATIQKNVLPVISTDDPIVTLRKLNDIGLELSKIFTPLICFLLYEGRLKETIALCHKIKTPIDFSKVIQPLITAYKANRNVYDCAKIFKFAPKGENYPDEFLSKLFGEYSSAKELSVLKEFRRAFDKLGIQLVYFNEEKIEGKDKREIRSRSSDEVERFAKITHPSKMNIEELECHLIELRAKGMNDRGILRKLLQLYCRENKPERVEQIRKEFEINGYPWTPGMYSSLLQFYAQNGKAEESLRLYRHLRKNFDEFKIDNFKIIQLATALVNENYISEAIELLESTRSDGGPRISKDCWRLLNSVAHGQNSELTESILDILVNAGFCERTNVTLGPLVREHLVKNDVIAAFNTFKKCANMYRHTPLRQELITAIVTEIKTDKSKKEEYTKYLDEIHKLSMDIYGGTAVNIDLLTALARNEMIDELRILLTKHRIKEEDLIHSLKHISDKTKMKILMTILDNTTEESGLDRGVVYEYTLHLCNRLGDCPEALEIWKKMYSDNIIPSEKCRKEFTSLLQHHKVELPEEFAKSQQV